MNSTSSFILFSLLIFSVTAIANSTRSESNINSIHNSSYPFHPLSIEEDLSLLSQLNSKKNNYPAIRIHADYSLIEDSFLKEYLQNDLVPASIDYFKEALQIKRPLMEAVTLLKSQNETCGLPVPSVFHNEGVKADMIFLVNIADEEASYAAESYVCEYSTTGRPVIVRLSYNPKHIQPANGNSLIQERNHYLTLHEMLHAFGFSKSSFKYFIDENGNRLVNHTRNIIVGGEERMILDVEPLTLRLRKHLGCPTLPGALLENDGSSGCANNHFERRLFLNEVMTSGIVTDQRISEFSLAVLQGSGWYNVDFSYAEPFTFGQGQGCDFYNGPQITERTEEFCTESEMRGCSSTRRSGGICVKDSRSDGYFYVNPKFDFDCANSEAEVNARLKGLEVFGREANSKCFEGSLRTHHEDTKKTSFCFQFECQGEGLDTVLEVKIGKQRAICIEEGDISVPGFTGKLSCPDPLHFCKVSAERYCPRNCMGRGDCINNQCMCKPGFEGIDCSNKLAQH